jgi:DNA-binding NtrC family response regulator
MATILCLDDEAAVGVVLEHALQKMGHRPLVVRSVDAAMETLQRTAVDLIISDYRMPRATGLDLLGLLQREGFQTPVIMMTGYSSIEHAVTSIKRGAIDYLTKPVRSETLEIAVSQALEVVRLRRENDRYRHEISTLRSGRRIVGDSAPLRQVLDTLATVAPTRATVLLEGESGTGKELFARFLHEHSPRHDKPFVSLNCAAMPEGLVESGLFGHEKGAFTGATARTAGAFERAHEGTLLLDEISEMRLDLQAKLLRVIQEHEFLRVGGHQPVSVNVRIVATTNRNLKAEVEAGRFREDLYYRLNVVPVRSPPLRERPDDIPLLVRHFVREASVELNTSVRAVTPETIDLLCRYHWPGNVRELANVVQRAVILCRGDELTPMEFAGTLHDAPSAAARDGNGEPDGGVTLPAGTYALDRIEAIMIQEALVETGGNRTKAAKLLNISERTLRNKLNAKR